MKKLASEIFLRLILLLFFFSAAGAMAFSQATGDSTVTITPSATDTTLNPVIPAAQPVTPKKDEPHSVVVLEFVKERAEQGPDSAYFNILKITNNNGVVINGTVRISVPQGWTLISPKETAITVSPGGTEYIPFRVSMSRTVTGGVAYLVNASLSSTRSLFPGKNQLSVSKSCYVEVPKKRQWDIYPVQRSVYFDRYSQYSPMKLRMINRGNGSEVVKLDFDIGSALELYGALGNRYFTSVELRPHTDTVFIFPFKYIPYDEAGMWNKDFRKLSVLISATADTLVKRTAVNFKYLESTYFNKIYGVTTPLNLHFQIQNMISDANPRMLLGLNGLIQLKNHDDIDYNLLFMNLPFVGYTADNATDFFWQRSRMLASYKSEKWKIMLGDISSYTSGFLGAYGRGVGGEYRINKSNLVGGTFTAAVGTPIYNATLFHDLLLPKSIPLKTALMANVDQYNKMNTYGVSFQTSLNFLPGQSIMLMAGSSITQHNYTDSSFVDQNNNPIITNDPGVTRLGFASQIGYELKVKKLTAGLIVLYTSGHYSQNFNGRFSVNGTGQYSINKKYYLIGTSGIFLQDPIVYSRGILGPYNRYLSGVHKVELARVISNRLTFFTGPLFEHIYFSALKFQSVTGDSVHAKFRSFSPKLSVRVSYRNNISSYISPYATFGYTYITTAEDSSISISPSFKPQPLFFNFRTGLNVIQGNWGMNLYYYLGPSSLVSQSDYYYYGAYSKSLRIMPYFQKYYFRKTMLFSSYNSYSFEAKSNSERIALNAKLKFFLGRDWTFFVENNLYASSRVSPEGGKSYSRSYFLNIGIHKSFDIPQPRVKYYDLKAICFNDLNGNLIKDDNEHGLSDIVVSIDRKAQNDSVSSNTRKQGSQFSPAEMITNNFGEISYFRIPEGEFELHITPMINLVNLYNVNGQVQTVSVSMDTTYYIPFTQSYRVIGSVIVNRDEFSSAGPISVSSIRVLAMDSLGNSFPALTSQDGSYILYVPKSGKYKVTVNNVLGELFILQESEFEVIFNGSREFHIDFIFNEKKRQMNISGANTTTTTASTTTAASTTASSSINKPAPLIIAGQDTLRDAKIVTDSANAATGGGNAQPRSQDSSIPVGPGISYRIQLATTTNKIPASQYAVRFKNIGNISEYSENGIYKYTSGDLTTVEEAKKLKTAVRSKGFSDAFMVPFYKGSRVKY